MTLRFWRRWRKPSLTAEERQALFIGHKRALEQMVMEKRA